MESTPPLMASPILPLCSVSKDQKKDRFEVNTHPQAATVSHALQESEADMSHTEHLETRER